MLTALRLARDGYLLAVHTYISDVSDTQLDFFCLYHHAIGVEFG
jgi:hypothetical protein